MRKTRPVRNTPGPAKCAGCLFRYSAKEAVSTCAPPPSASPPSAKAQLASPFADSHRPRIGRSSANEPVFVFNKTAELVSLKVKVRSLLLRRGARNAYVGKWGRFSGPARIRRPRLSLPEGLLKKSSGNPQSLDSPPLRQWIRTFPPIHEPFVARVRHGRNHRHRADPAAWLKKPSSFPAFRSDIGRCFGRSPRWPRTARRLGQNIFQWWEGDWRPLPPRAFRAGFSDRRGNRLTDRQDTRESSPSPARFSCRNPMESRWGVFGVIKNREREPTPEVPAYLGTCDRHHRKKCASVGSRTDDLRPQDTASSWTRSTRTSRRSLELCLALPAARLGLPFIWLSADLSITFFF